MYLFIYSACQAPISVQWQPDGSTIRTQKWFLGAGFLGSPFIALTMKNKHE